MSASAIAPKTKRYPMRSTDRISQIGSRRQKDNAMHTSQTRSSHRGTVIFSILLLLGLAQSAKAQYTIMPTPFQTVFSNSGLIINGGCVWTYLAGTTTAATTYTTSSGTANSNPIQANSAGRFTAFLEPGVSYKFVYESACTPPAHGTTLRTADNITAVPPSSANLDLNSITAGETIAAGAVIYLSDGSGGNAAGSWYNADADFTYASSAAAIVGMSTAAIASGSTGSVRIQGRVTGLTALSAGELYYVSATTGATTATPPTNAWLVGKADSTTSLIVAQNQGGVRLPDSDGTHGMALRTSSNLTADRVWTVVFGDANRTVTLNGDVTLNDWFDQSVKVAATPTFAGLTVSGTTAAFRGLTYTMPSANAVGTLTNNGSGTLTWVQNKVVQIVSATYATQTASSSSTYADTGLTASITPTSASNSVLVLVSQSGTGKDTGNTSLNLRLLRAGGSIAQMATGDALNGSASANFIGSIATMIVDAPATTSATTYKTQFASAANIANVYVQNNSAVSSIVLIEITP